MLYCEYLTKYATKVPKSLKLKSKVLSTTLYKTERMTPFEILESFNLLKWVYIGFIISISIHVCKIVNNILHITTKYMFKRRTEARFV